MTILQALNGYYDRMAARGDVTPPGWSIEPIGVVIVVAEDGSIVAVRDLRDPSGKKGSPVRVPKWFGRAGQGSTPFIFWDNTAYALGVSTKDPGKTQRDHDAFRRIHLDELADVTDAGLVALRCFLERWTPDQFVEPHFNPKMLAFNVAFRLDGNSGFIHERAASIAVVDRLRESAAASRTAYCLVTGQSAPVVRLHPKIKGISGTASAEVPLVSFNEPAFESYGHEQGFNAPTSQAAATRYTSALTALLDRSTSANRLKHGIGDATVIFWADTSKTVTEETAQATEVFFAQAAQPPTDRNEAVKIRDALLYVAEGKPINGLDPKLCGGTQFHVLGLSPNIARLSVRYWVTDSFQLFAQRLADHYRFLHIEPTPLGWTLPSVDLLLARTTALLGKFDNIPNALAGEVTRAILTGAPYPRTMLSAVIQRLRAGDDRSHGWHAAVIKAYVNRHLQNNRHSGEEDLSVALNPESKSAAYQLGRLFAVMEAAQFAALGQVNAPIGDRYYGAASATPARVFPALLRGLKVHVADARKRGRGGWIEPKAAEIISHLDENLPRTLRLEDQGRFAVGYYHERGQARAKAEATAQGQQGGETGE